MEEEIKKFNFFTMFWEGFKSMTIGKVLWTIVIIKLIIMFLILRPFFFPNFLNSTFENEESKIEYLQQELYHVDESVPEEVNETYK